MFLNYQYALAKIKAKKKILILQRHLMSLTLKHGAYDKKVRDVEPIGDINDYYEKYPVFANYPAGSEDMTKIDETVGSIAKIKEICEENGVNLVVILSPVYKDYLEYFPKER